MRLFIFVIATAFAGSALAAIPPPPPPPPDDDAQPQAAAPVEQPPPPPPAPPPPTAQPMEPPQASPSAQPQPQPPPSGVPGEWVYTAQYGWVWMPYERDYTYVNTNSGVAYAFVFYPGFGWRWVLAPWVFGLGPRPFFAHGPGRFVWYAHPWFRVHPLLRPRHVVPVRPGHH